MKVFEILNFIREPLKRLLKTGIRLEDCQYLELYSDYLEMRSRRLKITYIIASLSSKYHISERKIYYIIRKMEKDCNSGAV